MIKKINLPLIISVFTLGIFLSGCGAQNVTSNPSSSNPTVASGSSSSSASGGSSSGDIPDNQAFVKYISPSGGYELTAPEGWARRTKNSDVNFQDKLDGVQVTVSDLSTPPTVQSVEQNQAADLKKSGKGVTVKSIKKVQLKGEAAILIVYDSNSDPDPVTGKQIQLENNNYLFYKNGKLATLKLWAPLGADNVDQWNLMSNSFNWR